MVKATVEFCGGKSRSVTSFPVPYVALLLFSKKASHNHRVIASSSVSLPDIYIKICSTPNCCMFKHATLVTKKEKKKHATLVTKKEKKKKRLFIIFPLTQFQLCLGDSGMGIVHENANFSGSETDFPWGEEKKISQGKRNWR